MKGGPDQTNKQTSFEGIAWGIMDEQEVYDY